MGAFDEAVRAMPAMGKMCEWTYDEFSDSWDTACDNKHCFMTDGPHENNHRYCPYCGLVLSADPASKEKA